MSKESTQIHVLKSIRDIVQRTALPGETYSDTIERVFQDETVTIEIPAGLFNQLAVMMSEEAKPVAVNSLFSRVITRFGALLGFRGENFWDWGAQESAKANMILFCDIDDNYTALSAAASKAMSTLIKLGAYEFEPVLEHTLEAIETAFTRMFPERVEE